MIVGWCLLVFNVGHLYLSVVPMVFLCSVANVLLICYERLLFSYLHADSLYSDVARLWVFYRSAMDVFSVGY